MTFFFVPDYFCFTMTFDTVLLYSNYVNLTNGLVFYATKTRLKPGLSCADYYPISDLYRNRSWLIDRTSTSL